MPWFPVDDGFAFHHKAIKAGNAALGLWARAGSWCAQQLTDGHVPADMVKVLGTEAQARRLVGAGLWNEVDGGYQFHGWTEDERNPTRAKVEDRRSKAKARKARSRAQDNQHDHEDATSIDPRSNDDPTSIERGADDDRSTIEEQPSYNAGNSDESQVNEGSHNGTRAREGAGAFLSSPLLSTPGELSNESSSISPSTGERETSRRSSKYPDGFEEFWSIYPKRVGKQAAVKAWRKAIKLVTVEEILDGARRYAASRQGEDPKYTAHPSTWLNAGRWDDEPQPAYTPPPEQSTKDQRIARLQALKGRISDEPPGEERTLRALPSGGVA